MLYLVIAKMTVVITEIALKIEENTVIVYCWAALYRELRFLALLGSTYTTSS